MTQLSESKRQGERGIALVTSLLATMFILALGMAVVLSTSTDTTSTRAKRVADQAFFAADAGIGTARKALVQAFQTQLTARINALTASPPAASYAQAPTVDPDHPDWFPPVQVIPNPDPSAEDPFYAAIRTSAASLATDSSRMERMNNISDSSFSIVVHPFTGTITPAAHAPFTTGTEVIVVRYWLEVTGTTTAGGSATVNETGNITANINMNYVPASGTSRDFSFSGFGAFFDNGDTNNRSYLASGTFTGPVHTNSHFAINSSSGHSVTFRNIVSQVDSQIRWGDSNYFSNASNTTPNTDLPTLSSPLGGITISTEGYAQTSAVPLPPNSFSQEYSVINSTGIVDLNSDGTPEDPPRDGSGNPNYALDSHGDPLPVFDSQGQVTAATLAANLRNVNGNPPSLIGNPKVLANGVYISSADGTNVTGSGIYVQGGADDVQLIADTNGDQVIIVRQGPTTTTIRESFTSNRTTISNGSTSRTLNGLFTDKSDPANPRNGGMLFVADSSGNGSIASLRGGTDSSNNKPAIAAQTALTITAQRNITITGDLKYANPVTASDGTPVSNINSIGNVLGIFTDNGNVVLAPNSNYLSGSGLSLEMNAAVVSFNSKTSDDSSAINRIDGSITYGGSSSTSSSDRWRLVGSRVQAKINSIGYSNRDIYYDIRFSGGHFRPPFFPGTSYALGPPPTPGSFTFAGVATPTALAISWFRNNN